MPSGVLAIIGSGEISPGLTKIHRELLSRHGGPALLLTSTFGFQENIPQLTEKITDYFRDATGTTLVRHDLERDATEVQRAQLRQALSDADYVFAGPGSPSYAMSAWGPAGLTDSLADVLHRGGTVTFASAAACTLGQHCAPIYEIYKVGHDPQWIDGLNLLSYFGLNASVIPHFDNAEGGNHDTRYCYLGARRLATLQAQLPLGEAIFGVDEYTVAIFREDERTVEVHGRGHAYWITPSRTVTISPGAPVSLDDFGAATRHFSPGPEKTVSDLDTLVARIAATSPDAIDAVATLVRRAATGGDGFIDPSSLFTRLLEIRRDARAERQFALADAIRDAIVATGVEVKDGPDGSTWAFPASS